MSLYEFDQWAMTQMKEKAYNDGYGAGFSAGRANGILIGALVALGVIIIGYLVYKTIKK